MNDSRLIPAPRPCGGLICTPHGTVTIQVDDLNVLRVFSEPKPDPEDWAIAVGYVRRVADGTLISARADGPVDVFTVSRHARPGDAPQARCHYTGTPELYDVQHEMTAQNAASG